MPREIYCIYVRPSKKHQSYDMTEILEEFFKRQLLHMYNELESRGSHALPPDNSAAKQLRCTASLEKLRLMIT